MSTIEIVGGELTIIAPERNHRPVGISHRTKRQWWQFWRRPPGCPFCLGQEAENVDVHRQSHPTQRHTWLLRIIRNKWPLHECHEVVIFSPSHDATLAQLGSQHIHLVLQNLRDRVKYWHNRGIRVALFINHGRLAGASQEHPHAQIVGLPAGQAVRFPDYGQAVISVSQTTSCQTFVPAVPEFDFETVIAPHDPVPVWEASDELLAGLSADLGRVLACLESQEPGLPYNVIFDPETSRIRVTGRKYARAGYELATGCRIIHIDPVAWADQLRAA